VLEPVRADLKRGKQVRKIHVMRALWSSDSEVRKQSQQPLMRTSESKEL
jgi:hypothetical protein